MSLLRHQTLMMAALLASASLPAGAGRVVVVDDETLRDKPRRRLDPEPLPREPIRGARLSRAEALKAYATPPADQARADAAAAKRARRQARNLRNQRGSAGIEFIVALVILVATIWLIYLGAVVSCSSRWEGSGLKTDYGWLSGCRVQETGGRWIPEDALRGTSVGTP